MMSTDKQKRIVLTILKFWNFNMFVFVEDLVQVLFIIVPGNM